MAEQENYLDDICIRSPIVEIRKKADNQSRKAGEGMGITDDMACWVMRKRLRGLQVLSHLPSARNWSPRSDATGMDR